VYGWSEIIYDQCWTMLYNHIFHYDIILGQIDWTNVCNTIEKLHVDDNLTGFSLNPITWIIVVLQILQIVWATIFIGDHTNICEYFSSYCPFARSQHVLFELSKWLVGQRLAVWSLCNLCKCLTSAKSIALLHTILDPAMGVTLFNSGFKSDPTKLFPSIVLVTVG
jgi:hypothetical protein